MWLVHVPTGERVCLGKRMGKGWYRTGNTRDAEIRALFEAWRRMQEEGTELQDHFQLVMEDGKRSVRTRCARQPLALMIHGLSAVCPAR